MILFKVVEVISATAQCPAEKVVPDAQLKDLGLDSLKAITVLYDLEEEFDIEIPNERIENMRTVADIVSEIDALRKAHAA